MKNICPKVFHEIDDKISIKVQRNSKIKEFTRIGKAKKSIG